MYYGRPNDQKAKESKLVKKKDAWRNDRQASFFPLDFLYFENLTLTAIFEYFPHKSSNI